MRSGPAASHRGTERRRRSPWPVVVAGLALFVALGGSAVAANGLIQSKDIAKGAVTTKAVKNGAIMPWDLNRSTRMWVQATTGARGAPGSTGATGDRGLPGATGAPGSTGLDGSAGVDGTDGVVAPLSATAGLTPLPTATPPTVVVALAVPAGDYVVWAKTQLSHTGAGDSVDCVLKAGATTLDRVAMKTLPALAAMPVSMQAVTTTSPTQLSVECDVLTANGAADHSSLIAIPIG